MERAVDGAETVVHLAAFHGGYRPPPTDETRFDINVVGTFRMFQACLKKGVGKVVWASSTAANSKKGIYSITKVIGEDLCEYYHLTHGFGVTMLRFGSFTPLDFLSYGERLLDRGIDVRDCAVATERAIRLLAQGNDLCERFNLVACAFLPEHDRRRIIKDGEGYLRSVDPSYPDLLSRYGISMPSRLPNLHVATAGEVLDMQPSYTFLRFLADLKRLDRDGRLNPNAQRWRFEDGIPAPRGLVWPLGLE
jgi:hypothetical protein